MRFPAVPVLLFLSILLMPLSSYADYDDYCYEMAAKLALDPSQMKLGELDGLKSCIGELQRAGVVMHKKPAAAREMTCPTPDLDILCPKPKLSKVCPPFMDQLERNRQKSKQKKEDKKRYKPVIQAF